MYHDVSENIPVIVEIAAGFILQRGAKVEAAFVDEKLDELSKKTERKRKKKETVTSPEDGIQCADKNK